MSSRRLLEKQIVKANQEVESLRAEIAARQQQISLKEAYIQGMKDSLKYLPKSADSSEALPQLRAGSDVATAREILLKAGKPLHVNEILKLMGKDVNKQNRVSVAGYINYYFKKGLFFKKTSPNTFLAVTSQSNQESEVPPDGFGEDK